MKTNREFRTAQIDDAISYVRSLGAGGARTVWVEVWTGRAWELSYGSDPESVEAHLRNAWDPRGRVRVRVPDDVRAPNGTPRP